jgi:hypothetical protein
MPETSWGLLIMILVVLAVLFLLVRFVVWAGRRKT